MAIRFSVVAGFGLLILSGLFIGPTGVSAETPDGHRYSIRFNDMPLAEALDLLARTAGVRIHVQKAVDDRITKAYTNQPIDHIIRDMFKKMSYVSVWTYGEQRVEGIDIWVFDEDKSGLDQPASARIATSRTPSETDAEGTTDSEKDAEPEDQETAERRDDRDSEAAGTAENEHAAADADDSQKEEPAESADEGESTESESDAPASSR